MCWNRLRTKKTVVPDLVKTIIPISWKTYVRPILEDLEIDVENVWIVGKGVHDLLLGKYARGNNWIYQPNARSPYPEFYMQKAEREKALQRAVKKALERPDSKPFERPRT